VVDDLAFRAGGALWRWEDFYKNAIVFGQPGSGKTSCVLNALLEGLLASAWRTSLPPSGLILDPKGDFGDKLAALCRRLRSRGRFDRARSVRGRLGPALETRSTPTTTSWSWPPASPPCWRRWA